MQPECLLICASLLAALSAQSPPPRLPAGFAERLAILEREYAAQPARVEVMDALAGSYAMAGRYGEAIRIVEQMLAAPGADNGLHMRLARLYAWNGQSEKALAALNALGKPVDSETAEFRCQVLSGSAKAAAAIECYRALLTNQSPGDVRWAPARLALARNLAWSGRTRAAVGQYRAYHDGVSGDRQAAMEWIRLLLQTGSYETAERICDELLVVDPGDARVMALKAEVLHWSGRRSHEALQLAQTAASLDPALPDARLAEVYALRDRGSQRAARQSFDTVEAAVLQSGGVSSEASYAGAYRYLEREFNEAPRLSAEAAYSDYQDSDGIRDRAADLRLAVTAGDHLLRLDFERYTSSAPVWSIFGSGAGTAAARRATAGVDLNVAPGMYLRAAGGGYSESGEAGIHPAFRIAWSAEPVDRWAFEASVAREPVPLTPKSISQGIAFYAMRGTIVYHLDTRTSASVSLDRRIWSDSNRSLAADAYFQRVLRHARSLSVAGGLQAHFEAYRYDMLSQSGYFSPDYCARYEASLGAHGEIGRQARYEVRGESGVQRLAQGADMRRSSAFSSSLRLRLHKRLGLLAGWQWRNYSLLHQSGWYRQLSLQLDFHQ